MDDTSRSKAFDELLAGKCGGALMSFIECAKKDHQLQTCQDTFKAMEECMFIEEPESEPQPETETETEVETKAKDEEKDEEEEHNSALGEFAKSHLTPFFDPDAHEHKKTGLGGFFKTYFPRFFTEDEEDD